jgi:hypothetical protein
VSERTILRRAKDTAWDEAGTWSLVDVAPDRYGVVASCPLCGGTGQLFRHTVADDGTVNPSYVCPYEPCTFHEMVTLADWKPAPAPSGERAGEER